MAGLHCLCGDQSKFNLGSKRMRSTWQTKVKRTSSQGKWRKRSHVGQQVRSVTENGTRLNFARPELNLV
jgi:hypothetical protein